MEVGTTPLVPRSPRSARIEPPRPRAIPPLRGAVGLPRYVNGTVPDPGRSTMEGGSIGVKLSEATA